MIENIKQILQGHFNCVYYDLVELNEATDVQYPVAIISERNRSLDFNRKRTTYAFHLVLLSNEPAFKEAIAALQDKAIAFASDLYSQLKCRPSTFIITPVKEQHTDVISGVQIEFSITNNDPLLC